MSADPIPLHRRLLGMSYDFLLGGFLALLAGFLISGLLASRDMTIEPGSWQANSIFVLELLVGLLYMIWFIRRKGQTPGMLVWKVKIVDTKGETPGLLQIFLRYAGLILIMAGGFTVGLKVLSLSSFSALGLAIFFAIAAVAFAYLHPSRLALHEIISGTQLINVKN